MQKLWIIAFISSLHVIRIPQSSQAFGFSHFSHKHLHTHTRNFPSSTKSSDDCMQTNCCSRIISGKHQLAMLVVMCCCAGFIVSEREREMTNFIHFRVCRWGSRYLCVYILLRRVRERMIFRTHESWKINMFFLHITHNFSGCIHINVACCLWIEYGGVEVGVWIKNLKSRLCCHHLSRASDLWHTTQDCKNIYNAIKRWWWCWGSAF